MHMNYPTLADDLRLKRLSPPTGKVRVVMDTDTYNEVDDQFAVTYALLSPNSMDVEAIHAAPFWNDKSTGPADGMERSHEEILRLLDRLGVDPTGKVFRGSTGYLQDGNGPFETEATRDLITRALASGKKDPLYVVAIGAITNVASAILLEPEIIRHMVVVWLGGQPLNWPDNAEFNLKQDPEAAKVVFDSGVPVVHVPCFSVASHLLTNLGELDQCLRGQGAIGDYLYDTFKAFHEDHYAWSKEIWDIAAVAWLINSNWLPSDLAPSPLVNAANAFGSDPSRHPIRTVRMIYRNPIFRDMFRKIEAFAAVQKRA
jgi:purine nucleosidase